MQTEQLSVLECYESTKHITCGLNEEDKVRMNVGIEDKLRLVNDHSLVTFFIRLGDVYQHNVW